MESRTVGQQVVFRFAYAVGLLRGAESIRDAKRDIGIINLPAYLLIGFSIENALAAFLIAHEHKNYADYKGHDLSRAMRACATLHLHLSKSAKALITELSPMHQDFIFRYPEKMDEVSLPKLEDACRIMKEIIRDVQTVLLMKGFDITAETERL